MYRVVFTSRASTNFTRVQVKALCDDAAARNRETGITGLFLFDGSRFLQAIEGDERAVVSLMQRIAVDPKHFNVLIVSSHRIDAREFFDWTMSQPLYGFGDDEEEYVRRIKADLRHVSDVRLKASFIGFAALARKARLRYE